MAVEKKKFFEIELPIINEKIELIGNIEDDLIGRSVKMDLTRILKGKSMELVFKIEKTEGKIKAVPKQLTIFGYFIRRMMRKAVNYVEDSFQAECKDAIIRIKPFLITRKKVSRKIRTALRNLCKEDIEKTIKDKKVEEVIEEILSGRFQRSLSLKLKKVYPLSFCDIRDFIILKQKEKIPEEKVE